VESALHVWSACRGYGEWKHKDNLVVSLILRGMELICAWVYAPGVICGCWALLWLRNLEALWILMSGFKALQVGSIANSWQNVTTIVQCGLVEVVLVLSSQKKSRPNVL
jgi:hypothetical protein